MVRTYFAFSALCGFRLVDAAAFGAGRFVDDGVDEGRLAAMHGSIDSAFVSSSGVVASTADAAEGFDHLVVARALDEHGRRDVLAARRVHVGAAIDAVVVEDDDANRQVVAADGLDFHAAEAERAVAFDRDHRLAGRHRRGDGEAHADAHDAPRADIEALARLVHVDDAARVVERVGAFVDDVDVRTCL